MEFRFNSIDEIREFMDQLKGARGGRKGKSEEAETEQAPMTGTAPAPLQPPAVTPGPTFAPQAQPAATAPVFGALAAAPAGPDPAVTDLVGKICARWNESVAANPATGDAALKFFRDNVGNPAATKEQIQGTLLAGLPLDALKKIAGLVGIQA